MATTTAAGQARPAGAPESGTPQPRTRRRRGVTRSRLPYLLLLPALVLELAIHIIPMLVGVWMSLIELTQFHIRDWSTAPYVGLGNYKATLDFNTATGQQLLHSFWVTALYTLLSVGLSWA